LALVDVYSKNAKPSVCTGLSTNELSTSELSKNELPSNELSPNELSASVFISTFPMQIIQAKNNVNSGVRFLIIHMHLMNDMHFWNAALALMVVDNSKYP
jgi:hypothetical protein